MKNNALRSPLFYVGDKYKIVNEIKSHFPNNIETFVEPFVGGGSVFMNVSAQRFILNDIDKNIIEIHEMLCSYADFTSNFFDQVNAIVEHYGLSCSYKKDIVPND